MNPRLLAWIPLVAGAGAACTADAPPTPTNSLQALTSPDGGVPSRAIALVGGPSSQGALRRGDAALIAHFAASGIEVRTVGCTAAASATAGAQLVILSATCRSMDVGPRYADDPRPVVVLEPSLFDDMRQAGPTREHDHGKLPDRAFETAGLVLPVAVTIARPDHVVAAGLTGDVTVYSQPHPLNYARPSGAAITVAHLVGDPARATVFLHDRGAAMHGGVPAPARRVGLFLFHTDEWNPPPHDDVGPVLTVAGSALVEAAVRWAAGDLAPTTGNGDLRSVRQARPWHPGTGATPWEVSPAWSRGIRSWSRRADQTFVGLDASGTALVETTTPIRAATAVVFRRVGGAELPAAEAGPLAAAFEIDHGFFSYWGRDDYPAPPTSTRTN